MPNVILKYAENKGDAKIRQLSAGEIAIVTSTSEPSIAFKDHDNNVVYLNAVEFENWDNSEPKGVTIKNGFDFNNNTPRYNVTGSFSYSGNVPSSGGTISPSNTLQLTKNGSVIPNPTITYTSSQPYASVTNDGKVTFASHTGTSIRSAIITVTISYEGYSATKTASVSQSAHVTPTDHDYIYAGGAATSNASINISQFNEVKSVDATSKSISFTIEGHNIVAILCPTTLSLTSCKKLGEIVDDITNRMSSSNVTYNDKPMKLYQFKYLTGLLHNQTFEAIFA